jgi:hypothetical protein
MNNYYIGQLTNYIANYDDAIKKMDTIYNSLENLSSAFQAASGEDIARIKNDIETIKTNVLNIKKTIKASKDKTVANAESSDRCYNKYLNKKYAENVETEHKYYSDGVHVFIDDQGRIHVAREYVKKQSFLETIFMPRAGEGYDEFIVDFEEMFNS